MNDLSFMITRIVVTVIAALVTAYVIPYLKRLAAAEQYKEVITMVEIAVRAAEQTFDSGMGRLKKEQVMGFVTNWLNDRGIVITTEQLDQLIEAAVFEMNREADI